MTDFSQEFHPRSSLTDREMEVLKELLAGKSLRDIGASMKTSENAVKNHLRNISEKLRLLGGA